MSDKLWLQKYSFICLLLLLLVSLPINVSAQQSTIRKSIIPEPLLPEEIMDLLINEVSGEIQINNEKLLSSFNRNRSAAEYNNGFYESTVMLNKLKEYGIEDAGIEIVPIRVPGGKNWDAESAELWMLKPEKKKLICYGDVPSCLCERSRTSDVTAELVYAGPGNDMKYYEGKDVKDKIVLVSGYPSTAHSIAVYKLGAKGVISYHSWNMDKDPDQVGWSEIIDHFDWPEPENPPPTFGFMISPRMGNELRKILEQGEKIVVHAKCKTAYYPVRNEIVWALIKGSEKPEEELIFTAHLYEQMAYQGANDNASGCVSILETARVINKLIQEGKIPRPKRSLRFLWIDEIDGTLGYIQKHPELVKRWFANINEDMVGEALLKNEASFHLMTSPFSLPSFLDDVMINFIEYVGENNRNNIIHRPVAFPRPILSPAGSKDPFYYNIEKFYGGSDHMVFAEAGIGVPAVQFNVWPDFWYHTNKDRPDKSDSTQFKRVSVIDTAAAIYLTDAAKEQAIEMIGEILTRGASRTAEEEKRAFSYINKSAPENLPETYKEAKNIMNQSYGREEKALKSTTFFAPDDADFSAYLNKACESLLARKQLALNNLAEHYKTIAALRGVKPITPQLTAEEKRLDQLVPRRAKEWVGYFNYVTFPKRIEGKELPEFNLAWLEQYELRNFIDNNRSILEIRNALSPEFRFIPLKDVENYIKVLEIGGMVTIKKRSE
jgi:hypothetical protein